MLVFFARDLSEFMRARPIQVFVVLNESWTPSSYGPGNRKFTLHAQAVPSGASDLTYSSIDVIELRQSMSVPWTSMGVFDPRDAHVPGLWKEMERFVIDHFEQLGIDVRRGYIATPKDITVVDGDFECVQWSVDQDGKCSIRFVEDGDDDEENGMQATE